MPRTLADGRTRLVALTTQPADMAAVTVTEVTAGVRLETRIAKSDFRLSPTGSDTVSDADLAATGNAVTYGASNYEGSITPFRELTEAGLADPTNDVAWDTFKEKGTLLWLLKSEGKKASEAFAAGDEYEIYEVVTDNAQDPSDRGGYIKKVVPLGVQDAVLNGVIGAGA